ncbi:MAG TPA: hypothetical protein VGN72_03320 [Tepidisphaeraceae bacterium]|nr:hypothetical protein [Tepidisphaeraceae bacterium]
MIGITPAGTPDYSILKAAGFQWMRVHLGLPFDEEVGGALRSGFTQGLERLGQHRDAGLRLMCSTPTPGSSRFDPQTKQTRWIPSLPEWAGSHREDRYYQVLEESCAEMARQSRGVVDYWQVSNEPDIDLFRGPLDDDAIARFLLTTARGVKRGNPDAQCGINLGGPNDKARALAKEVYHVSACPFDYVGIDGYFGSWQRGGPDSWPAYIDEAHAMTGRPVIVAEWGYSSLHEGPITDDPGRAKPYNQDVCRGKRWGKVWRQRHTPEEQADYVRECIGIFTDHPHCIGNFFFRYGDTETCWQCGQRLCPAECAWGMIDVAGQPKPAYYALKESIADAFGAEVA